MGRCMLHLQTLQRDLHPEGERGVIILSQQVPLDKKQQEETSDARTHEAPPTDMDLIDIAPVFQVSALSSCWPFHARLYFLMGFN